MIVETYSTKVFFLNNFTELGLLYFSFRFPLNNTELLKKWTTATERKGFVPKKYTTLCSLHFTPNDFHEMLPNSTRKTLKNDAVPTIFDFLSHIPDSLPKERRTIIRNKSPVSSNK